MCCYEVDFRAVYLLYLLLFIHLSAVNASASVNKAGKGMGWADGGLK